MAEPSFIAVSCGGSVQFIPFEKAAKAYQEAKERPRPKPEPGKHIDSRE